MNYIGKMNINNTNRVPSKNVTNITHNVILSFEIGHKDVKDGVDTRAQNDTH